MQANYNGKNIIISRNVFDIGYFKNEFYLFTFYCFHSKQKIFYEYLFYKRKAKHKKKISAERRSRLHIIIMMYAFVFVGVPSVRSTFFQWLLRSAVVPQRVIYDIKKQKFPTLSGRRSSLEHANQTQNRKNKKPIPLDEAIAYRNIKYTVRLVAVSVPCLRKMAVGGRRKKNVYLFTVSIRMVKVNFNLNFPLRVFFYSFIHSFCGFAEASPFSVRFAIACLWEFSCCFLIVCYFLKIRKDRLTNAENTLCKSLLCLFLCARVASFHRKRETSLKAFPND